MPRGSAEDLGGGQKAGEGCIRDNTRRHPQVSQGNKHGDPIP